MTESIPDTVFGYILYFEGTVARCLSEHNSPESVWDAVFAARKSERPVIKFWNTPQNGKYTTFLVDATKVVAVRPTEEEISMVQPNLESRRRAEAQRLEAKMSRAVATTGQVVPRGAGVKR